MENEFFSNKNTRFSFVKTHKKVLTNIKAKKKHFLCEKASKIEGINHTRDVGTANGAGHRFPRESLANFPEKIFCVNFFDNFCLFSHTRVGSR